MRERADQQARQAAEQATMQDSGAQTAALERRFGTLARGTGMPVMSKLIEDMMRRGLVGGSPMGGGGFGAISARGSAATGSGGSGSPGGGGGGGAGGGGFQIAWN